MESNPVTLFRSGHIVVLGVPNTGKSTLFNALVGERLSITTPKPQTTRRTILGILTNERAQMMFVDTRGYSTAYRLHEFMRSQIENALEGADIVLALLDASDLAGTFTDEIRSALSRLQLPLVVAINKIDLVTERDLEQSLQQVKAACPPNTWSLCLPKPESTCSTCANVSRDSCPLDLSSIPTTR